MDVADAAVLQQCRGDEELVVGRLLDERDDDAHVTGRTRQLQQSRVVAPHGDLGVEVLQQVPGQPQLGEDDQVGLVPAGLADERVMALEVDLERTEARRDLGEGDADWCHGQSVCRGRRADAAAQYVSTRTGVSAKSLTLRVRTAASTASAAAAISASGKAEAVPALVRIPRHSPASMRALGPRLDELDRLQ